MSESGWQSALCPVDDWETILELITDHWNLKELYKGQYIFTRQIIDDDPVVESRTVQ